jgi:hypothetical protein
MTESEIKAEMMRRAKNPKAVKSSDKGMYINPGARYVFEVTAAKCFQSPKDDKLKAVVAFKVLEMTKIQPEEFFKTRGFPNPVGSECSDTFDLTDNFKSSLFYKLQSRIMNCTEEELTSPADPANPDGPTNAVALLSFTDSAKSPMIGLRVACNAFETTTKAGNPCTAKNYTNLPAPEGHPLAEIVNKVSGP